MGLAGAAVADGDDVFTPLHVFAPGPLHDQGLFYRGHSREVEGVQSLGGREAGRADPALHQALVSVGEFQFGEAQQVVGMTDTLGGALDGQLAVLPEKTGQLQFLEMVLKEQRGSVAHAALLSDSRVR